MRSIRDHLFSKNRGVLNFAVYAFTLAFLLLVLVIFIWYIYKIPMATLTRDPVQLLNGRPYTGMLSNLGIIIWSATAGICLFVVVLMQPYPEHRRERQFFLLAFVLTMVLLLDDLFLLHDVILPEDLDISENYLYAVYGILSLTFIIHFRKDILETPYLLLVAAVIFFGFSISVDTIVKFLNLEHGFILEDGTKFLGITSWGTYFIYNGYQTVKRQKLSR
jgi:hypothetical protein